MFIEHYKRLEEIGNDLGGIIPHRFDVITEVEPGVPVPLEAFILTSFL